MDPNENLYEQIRLAKELVEDPSDLDSSCRLAELVLAMDGWRGCSSEEVEGEGV